MTASGTSRRTVLGAGLVLATVAGTTWWMTPEAAERKAADWRSFTPENAALLGKFCEALVPGSVAAGVVRFIDHHVSVPHAQSLLMLRYLDVPPPYADFYAAAATALAGYIAAQTGQGWQHLEDARWPDLIRPMIGGNPPEWSGPPAPLVYFALRSDAIDMVYGTKAGFERLGIAYLAHIDPEANW